MMKRFKFSMIIGLLGLFGFTCFSNALLIGEGEDYRGKTLQANSTGQWIIAVNPNSSLFFCCSAHCQELSLTVNGQPISYSTNGQKCVNAINNTSSYENAVVDYINSSTSKITLEYHNNNFFSGGLSCPECQSCPSTSITLFHGDSFNVPISGVDNNLFIPIEDDYTVSENQFGGLNFSITHNSSLGSGYSQLFINDIEHNSAPIINVSIPEEINWNSSIDSGEFYLTVSGQNVDYEYIDGIIRTQKSSPNNTDFTNIVSGLIPLLIPGLVIILFIWFIFKFIKKIF